MDEDYLDHSGEKSMRDFITAYETLPVLWNTNLTSYKYKNKRKEAMEKLLKYFEKVQPGATVKDLSKKMNSIRVNFRKEMKKVIASKKSGSDPDSVYVPSSWMYCS
ncbi:hypothetical protein RI129_011925 [Pyrocoelia pectoralis]|uniref:MADF domain-containing protein n=1 Tax=Pyrocoelia pectoralis TaxID=417401 RepID=A0AAN7V2U1_9COLE